MTLAGLQAARGLALVVSGQPVYQHLLWRRAGPRAAGLRRARRAAVQQCRARRDARLRRLRRASRRWSSTPRASAATCSRSAATSARRASPACRSRRSRSPSTRSPALPSALAGIVHAGQFNFGSANDGTGYELTAIAAVVIGGTSLFGGSGSMVGTVAGTIMLGALANVLQLNNITPALQLLATAAIIVLAAVLQSLVRRREGLIALGEQGDGQGSRASGPASTRRKRQWTHADDDVSRHACRAALLAGTCLASAGIRPGGRPAGQGLREGRRVHHRLLAGQQRRALPPARQ